MFDEREAGRMIEQVRNLCVAVDALTAKVASMEKTVAYRGGAMAAVLSISAGAGAVGAMVVHWFRG